MVILYLRAIFHKNWQFTFNNSTHNFSFVLAVLLSHPSSCPPAGNRRIICVCDVCLLVILIAGHRHQYQAALMHAIINQRTQHAKIVDTESSFSISAVCQDLTPSWPCSHFVNIYIRIFVWITHRLLVWNNARGNEPQGSIHSPRPQNGLSTQVFPSEPFARFMGIAEKWPPPHVLCEASPNYTVCSFQAHHEHTHEAH